MAPKRKRAATLTKQQDDSKTSVPLEAVQPSSRDASDEETTDPVLQAVKDKQQQQQATNGDDVPAAKRSKQNDEQGSSAADALQLGEGGERESMKMAEVPKAGLVDPVGYKTNPPPQGRPVRIYADGVFDLFHLGHMRQLQQAKQAFPEVYLIVGVTGDKETHRRKGLTVLSGAERAESVRHCKWVDEVVEDCPWIIADHPEFIEKYKIDYIAHDDIPYGADECDDLYAGIKREGKFLVTQRTEGVSTTGIITTIVKDYEKYISRQLKRGTSRQELNVSWLKKNELDLKRSVAEIKDSIKTNWTTTGQELGKELKQFWQNANAVASGSRPASPAPGSLRGRARDVQSLELPRSPPNGQTGGPSSSDFAAGYSLGLIGGVRAWMMRSRKTLNESRGDESPDSGDELQSPGATSPVIGSHAESTRGKKVQQQLDDQVASEMQH